MTLVCSVKQGTPPIQFSWFHEKKTSPLRSHNSSKLNDSYSMTHVAKENEGKYYCVCDNPANDHKQSDAVAIQGVFVWLGFTHRQPGAGRPALSCAATLQTHSKRLTQTR